MTEQPEVILLDGGMSRELERWGATLRQPEWSALALLERPESVAAAHEAFVAAGADVITTNSYALVPFHIGEERFADRGAGLADVAGSLARAAAPTGVRVAGSLPPACGSYAPDAFDRAESARVLAVLVAGLEPHVDLWLAETMSSVEEARSAAAAVAGSGAPLWISFTLDDDTRLDVGPPRLRSGTSVLDAVASAIELGAEAVLFNCSMPEVMEPAIEVACTELARTGNRVAVGVYANALDSENAQSAANESLNSVRTDQAPEDYLRWAQRWVDAGATIVGGCCGTVAPHIEVLHRGLRA